MLKLCGYSYRKHSRPISCTQYWCTLQSFYSFFKIISIPVWSRTFIEFSDLNELRESDKLLKHELGSIQRSCRSQVSCWCCGSILVSYTIGGRFWALWMTLIFCSWIRWIHWKHLGKMPVTIECTLIIIVIYFVTFIISPLIWNDL